ncbi:hypothetical protein B0T21DRAFT_394292 [Apiosordaria backusii]|uniref:WSC domain-containing protein n=1 Tax=Apiosordaria backusii TaxID=314023 RepID=A0AA40B788_9PEZI|nr:hypothetical protein B0T21DRAFT_394292 [Apiosordaria backusii]
MNSKNSGIHLPIPNRERNEGGELEVVTHWHPQRARLAGRHHWRRQWEPLDEWYPHEDHYSNFEAEDDKPSEYSHGGLQRTDSFFGPKPAPTIRSSPGRRICGLKLSIFALSCAVVFLFASVVVIAALLGHKVASLETTMPSLATQQTRVDADPYGKDVRPGVGPNGTYVDDTSSSKVLVDYDGRDRSITGRSADATTRKTSASTTINRAISTRNTESTQHSTTKSGAITASATSGSQPNQESARPSTVDKANAGEPPVTSTGTAEIATKSTMMTLQIPGWKYLGCYEDSKDRILMGDFKQRNDMTNSLCAGICTSQEYKYFGTEFYDRMSEPFS